jgi:hypothetical protein
MSTEGAIVPTEDRKGRKMYKSTGTGLIGLGIVLVVIGAILNYAVTATTSGLNINTVGVILLAVGIGTFLVGAIVFGVGSFRQTTVRENVRMTPDGGHERVLQQHDNLA